MREHISMLALRIACRLLPNPWFHLYGACAKLIYDLDRASKRAGTASGALRITVRRQGDGAKVKITTAIREGARQGRYRIISEQEAADAAE